MNANIPRVIFKSIGAYLPRNKVTNEELSKKVDTSDDWIRGRTGISKRALAELDETATFMGAQAASQALKRAGLSPEDIDGIIVATSTPDQVFPALAVRIQAELGIKSAFGFDISAACSGFVYAVSVADAMLKQRLGQRFLVLGVEVFSRLLDWTDRTTCVLFGDGAGAVVLESVMSSEQDGILSTKISSDGTLSDILFVDGALGVPGTTGKLKMQGREVFRRAVGLLASSVKETLAANNMEMKDIDWLVPHQANQRIIEALAKNLDFPLEKVISTISEHANTSAASIPLALAHGFSDGRIKKGDLILMEALGGGLTWGAVLLRV
ncbi:ketoacyl-ACP synthase III [Acetobacteraceae bacterium]|nr:ketoacyl-ACP synthase III [Acetobacteraceae bacterium]